METFRQKLEALGLTAQQINEVRTLINTKIIGNYESIPVPDFATPADNDIAVRNALRREQRKNLV
jgi:hypothetical protein